MSDRSDASEPRSKSRRARAADRSPGAAAEVDSSTATARDYQYLFARAPDAILVVDRAGRYVDANDAATRLTGYTRGELLGMKVEDLAPSSDRASSTDRFTRLQREGQARSDRTLARKDGSTIVVEAHAVSLGDGTYLKILRDVTERYRAQEALQRSLDAYSTLVALCGAAVVSADAHGRLTSWNPAAEELFGYSAPEALSLSITDLVPDRLRELHTQSFSRHLGACRDERVGRTLCCPALRKDGSEIPVEIALASGQQCDTRVFTAVIRDMTEHRRVVDQLNDALQRLRFHMERMPLAYIVWDADFRVVEWNPAAERAFGHSREDAVGRHAFELIVPSDSVPQVERVWADLLAGDTSSHSVNRNTRKDGSSLTCEWFNTPLRDSHGHIRGVASMARDVTEREIIEARLREAQKFESLGVLASGVAHDFNSSLMVILGNAALLRSTKGLPREAIEHLELIEESGARANQLIKHLLTYARTGRHNPQPTDLNAVIADVLMFVRSSLGQTHKLELDLAPGGPLILADRGQLEQIILNLCMNAKQAMESGGTIQLLTRPAELTPRKASRCIPYDVRPGPYLELLIRDSGCGMDKSTLMHIFDPFFTTKAEGHGLGLAAVLGILRQHQAAAWVESKAGAGTDFHVFFPAYRPGSDETREPAANGGHQRSLLSRLRRR
jgi:PAS domain S-box-containing protein